VYVFKIPTLRESSSCSITVRSAWSRYLVTLHYDRQSAWTITLVSGFLRVSVRRLSGLYRFNQVGVDRLRLRRGHTLLPLPRDTPLPRVCPPESDWEPIQGRTPSGPPQDSLWEFEYRTGAHPLVDLNLCVHVTSCPSQVRRSCYEVRCIFPNFPPVIRYHARYACPSYFGRVTRSTTCTPCSPNTLFLSDDLAEHVGMDVEPDVGEIGDMLARDQPDDLAYGAVGIVTSQASESARVDLLLLCELRRIV
jgi:hypothetical protein